MPASDNRLASRLVLLIESDDFLSGYVGDAISAAAGQVLGPTRTLGEANDLIGRLRGPPHAAVVGLKIYEASGFQHVETLEAWGIPLLLISHRARFVSGTHDTLTAPFAAYQVVDHLCAKLSRNAESAHSAAP